MKKNYKLQNTKKTAHELHELTRNEGSHGLHQDTFKLQTMTALIKSFCGGIRAKRQAQGAKRKIRLVLYAKRQAPSAFPLAAGGKYERRTNCIKSESKYS